jgi:murein DD-endopeptidase MepM/ murein hydrolase activator NlpD
VTRIGDPPGASHAPKVDTAAKTAAKQLEAFFLRQLLAEARPKGGSGIDSGFANDTFKQMLDEAVADKVAAAGGMGMASMFAKQLGEKPALGGGELGPAFDGIPQLSMPVPGRIGSGYGPRVGHTGATHEHQGVDLTAAMGQPVAAAAAGTVIHAGPGGNYGNLVTVRHTDGVETRYAHLSAVGVKVGDTVTVGQALGNVGSTGLSDGPHLHFEIRKEGQPIDPTPLLPLNRSGFRTNR